MAKKDKKCQCEPGAPLWMTTFGDMMSLLLTFFVLLLSFSKIVEEEKFAAAILSIQGALGVLPAQDSAINKRLDPLTRRNVSRRLERIARELQRSMLVRGREKDVQIEFEKGGLKISLPSHVLFDSASAELKPDAFGILSDVSAILGPLDDAKIEVRGHTDSRPLVSSRQYADNYDLSYARAKEVANFLTRLGQVELKQLEMIARGPLDPVATNDTEEGRQANRRVELFIRGDFENGAEAEIQRRIEALGVVEAPRTGPAAP